MGNFLITGPDGKKYKVTGETPEGALQALQQHLGSQTAPASEADTFDQMLESKWNEPPKSEGFDQFKGMLAKGEIAPPVSSAQMTLSDPAKAFQRVDDTVRLAANGATFGLADRFAGYMNGTGKEAERARSEEARKRLGPVMAPVAEIGGSILPVSKLIGAGVTATRIPGMVGKLFGNVVDGTAIGAATAAGNDEDIGTGAAFGGAAGGAGQLVGKALTKALSRTPKTMSVGELQSMAGRAYDRADKAGVVFKPEAMGTLANKAHQSFAEFGYHPELHPGAKVALGELERLAAGGNVNLKGLDGARRIASQAYIPMNKSNNDLVTKIIKQIDEFAANAKPQDIVMGDAVAGSAALKEARNLWHRSAKLDTVEKLLEKAGRRAARSGSGGNVENTTRQELSKILDSEKRSRGFTGDEKAALEKAVNGTKVQNTLRQLGKFSPMGNGLIATLQGLTALGGASIGNPAIAPLVLGGAVAGTGAKLTSEAMQRNASKKLMELISSGGKASAIKPVLSKANDAQIKQIIRMMIAGGATGLAAH